jgi:hypothetical protein
VRSGIAEGGEGEAHRLPVHGGGDDEIGRKLFPYREILTKEEAGLFFLMRDQQDFEKYFTQNI